MFLRIGIPQKAVTGGIIMKEFLNRITSGKRPVIFAGAIYTVAWLVIVLSAWLINLHRYDLGRTISAYIGFRKWTVVFYFICATIIFLLISIYIHNMKANLAKKLVYFVVFICVWGCSIFPSNREWSTTISQIHLFFADGLMFTASFSFVLTMFTAKRKGQRIFSIATFFYALFFIISLLVMKWNWFENTIFLWENLCIYLLIVELLLETPKK